MIQKWLSSTKRHSPLPDIHTSFLSKNECLLHPYLDVAAQPVSFQRAISLTVQLQFGFAGMWVKHDETALGHQLVEFFISQVWRQAGHIHMGWFLCVYVEPCWKHNKILIRHNCCTKLLLSTGCTGHFKLSHRSTHLCTNTQTHTHTNIIINKRRNCSVDLYSSAKLEKMC